MTLEEYRDWYEFSGLCLDLRVIDGPSPHRSAYLDCLRSQLSEAGFQVLQVFNHFEHFRLPFDVQMFVDCSHPPEIPMLTAALHAMGATKLAAALAEAQRRRRPTQTEAPKEPATIPNEQDGNRAQAFADLKERLLARKKIREEEKNATGSEPLPAVAAALENPEEMRALLNRFVETHQAELNEDVRRHGDPRAQPGFNRRKARKAIEDRLDYCDSLRNQEEVAPELQAGLLELAGLINAQSLSPQDKEVARQIRVAVGRLRRDSERWATHDTLLVQPMAKWLKDARDLMARYPNVFLTKTQKQAAGYPAEVQKRLATIGPYQVSGDGRQIVWGEVAALQADYAGFLLAFRMDDDPPQGPGALLVPDDRMFELWDAYRKLHPEMIGKYREELMDHYRAGEPDLDLPENEILGMVRRGRLTIVRSTWKKASNYHIHVAFDIDWDEEHGLGPLIVSADGRIEERF